jgi:hypothetical protein
MQVACKQAGLAWGADAPVAQQLLGRALKSYPLGMRTALALALMGLLVVFLAACSVCPDADCPGPGGVATFQLSCSPNDLVSVVASGQCSTPDAGLPWAGAGTELYVAVPGLGPGVCHVEMTFATGFTYSMDVMFTSKSTCGGCSYLTTSGPFMVNNPPTTCTVHPDAAVGG